MSDFLEMGFELDRRWHWVRGEKVTEKKSDLMRLARILDEEGLPYAIIGGVALQVHRTDLRTTADIDLAVPHQDAIPRDRLRAEGFA